MQYNNRLSQEIFNIVVIKVKKKSKISNQYNKIPHQTQDTHRKVRRTQDIPYLNSGTKTYQEYEKKIYRLNTAEVRA